MGSHEVTQNTRRGLECPSPLPFPTGGTIGSGETSPHDTVLAWGRGTPSACSTSLTFPVQSVLISVIPEVLHLHLHVLAVSCSWLVVSSFCKIEQSQKWPMSPSWRHHSLDHFFLALNNILLSEYTTVYLGNFKVIMWLIQICLYASLQLPAGLSLWCNQTIITITAYIS